MFFEKTKATTTIGFIRAHKHVISRVITFSLVAFGAFWLSWGEAGPFYFLLLFALFVMLIAGQLFWIRRVLDIGERFIPGKPRRAWSRLSRLLSTCSSLLTTSPFGTARAGAIRPI